MFAVIFEVEPKAERWDDYLGTAKMLRPDLEAVDGFVDNVRYRSLTRPGVILSLSGWRDEKSVVRWRTKVRHHQAQERGRGEILDGYRLRVGEVKRDTQVPHGQRLRDLRRDETEVGEAKAVTLVDAVRPAAWVKEAGADGVAEFLGWREATGLVDWDVFEAVLTPGTVILLCSWRDGTAAGPEEACPGLPDGARRRQVRVVREYGMFDRREAPQYYPDAAGRPSLHA